MRCTHGARDDGAKGHLRRRARRSCGGARDGARGAARVKA